MSQWLHIFTLLTLDKWCVDQTRLAWSGLNLVKITAETFVKTTLFKCDSGLKPPPHLTALPVSYNKKKKNSTDTESDTRGWIFVFKLKHLISNSTPLPMDYLYCEDLLSIHKYLTMRNKRGGVLINRCLLVGVCAWNLTAWIKSSDLQIWHLTSFFQVFVVYKWRSASARPWENT